MKWYAAMRERLRALFFSARLEAESEEEMRFHVAMEAARRARERGEALEEAHRRAAVAFGGVDKHREQVRDARGFSWANGMSLDVKLGARMLRKYPGLTLAGGLALAIAFALASAWFEFLGDMTNPRIDFDDADRMVAVQNYDRAAAAPEPRSLHDFQQWRAQVRSIEELSAMQQLPHSVTTEDNRFRSVRGVRMTATGMRVPRVNPVLGRLLLESDEAPGAPLVAIIGFELWQQLFDGDRQVIGRTLRLGETPVTVVGVMPEGFGFPMNQELWVPLQEPQAYERGAGPPIRMFGRLADGATLEQAEAELTTIAERIAAADPTRRQLQPRVRGYDDVMGMTLLVQAVNLPFILFLVVVCANVATLGFARTAARSSEIALRSALGASRKRLIVQLGAESLVLTGGAAIVGLLAARAALGHAMSLFWEVQQSTPPFWFDAGMSWTTVLYAGVLAILAAAIIGGIPALKATGRKLRHQLVTSSTGGGMQFGRLATAVIVVQVALCVAFLPYAMMAARDLMPDREREAVFPADEFLSARVVAQTNDAPGRSADAAAQAREQERNELFAQVKNRLADVPGVAATTFASRIPGFNHVTDAMVLESDTTKPFSTRVLGVDHDFFRVMNARIVAGRGFSSADFTAEAGPLIVSDDFAREMFAGRNPIGQRMRYVEAGAGPHAGWREIVGVVDGMEKPIGPGESVAVYAPLNPGRQGAVQVYMRTDVQPATLVSQVNAAVTGVSPALMVDELLPLDDVWRPVLRADVFFLALLNVVAAIIVLFALAGIYSLMSFTVTQRAREIAIRSALGAEPRRIVMSIFGRAALQILLGITIGATLISLVVSKTPGGYTLVAGVSGLMLLGGFAGCVLPMLRAVRIHPTAALKAE